MGKEERMSQADLVVEVVFPDVFLEWALDAGVPKSLSSGAWYYGGCGGGTLRLLPTEVDECRRWILAHPECGLLMRERPVPRPPPPATVEIPPDLLAECDAQPEGRAGLVRIALERELHARRQSGVEGTP